MQYDGFLHCVSFIDKWESRWRGVNLRLVVTLSSRNQNLESCLLSWPIIHLIPRRREEIDSAREVESQDTAHGYCVQCNRHVWDRNAVDKWALDNFRHIYEQSGIWTLDCVLPVCIYRSERYFNIMLTMYTMAFGAEFMRHWAQVRTRYYHHTKDVWYFWFDGKNGEGEYESLYLSFGMHMVKSGQNVEQYSLWKWVQAIEHQYQTRFYARDVLLGTRHGVHKTKDILQLWMFWNPKSNRWMDEHNLPCGMITQTTITESIRHKKLSQKRYILWLLYSARGCFSGFTMEVA